MPIQFKCPKCNNSISVPDAAAGKQGKCKCGNPVKVPGAPVQPSAKSQPVSSSPSMSKAPASQVGGPTATGPANINTAGAPKLDFLSGGTSKALFDQISNADLTKTSVNPYAVGPSTGPSDASVLKKYVKEEGGKKKKKGKKSNAENVESTIKASAILHFIGAVVQIGVAVLLFAAGGLIAGFLGVNGAAGLGGLIILYAVVSFASGIWNVANGVGLLKRQTWGWWSTMIGFSYAIIDRLADTAMKIFLIKSAEPQSVGFFVGVGVFVALCLVIAVSLSSVDGLRAFNVSTNAAVRRAIVLGVGLVIALGFNAGKYVLQKSAESAAQTMEQAIEAEARESMEASDSGSESMSNANVEAAVPAAQ